MINAKSKYIVYILYIRSICNNEVAKRAQQSEIMFAPVKRTRVLFYNKIITIITVSVCCNVLHMRCKHRAKKQIVVRKYNDHHYVLFQFSFSVFYKILGV